MSQELESLIRKLNPLCRKALGQAAELCVTQTHFTVEIEHFILRLLEFPDTDALSIFRAGHLQPHLIRQQLEKSLEEFKRGNSRTPGMSQQIVQLLREAWELASLNEEKTEIRSGFIIKALFKSIALKPLIIESADLLDQFPEKVLHGEEFKEILERSGENVKSESGGANQSEMAKRKADNPALSQYTVNLTQQARENKIDPVLGREKEIRQVVDILTRRRQNNPILTGEAGVGKTAVVEGFALKVVAGEVPPALKNIEIHTLDLGLLQAGAGMKGEFENRLKNVIQEVKSSPVPIILFIDEAHTMIGAGGQAGQGDAANLLKPALARGELRTIAATTWAEYKKYFEKDAALTRRFQVVQVDEPTEEACCAMLRGVAEKLENHHQVRILEEAVHEAVRLSSRYISGRKLPDKAVSVLDTACARVAIGQSGVPAELENSIQTIANLKKEITNLEKEEGEFSSHPLKISKLKEKLVEEEKFFETSNQRWEAEKELTDEIINLQKELIDRPDNQEKQSDLFKKKEELKELQGENPMIPLWVDSNLVGSIVSSWTGIPLGKMVSSEMDTVLNLEKVLEERVIGQNHALASISKRIRTSRAKMEDPNKPVGVFLLVGPSGVGKTESALALTDIMYGGERNLITINMSEYQEAHTVSSLKGSPPGYVGYGQGGVLTEAVRRNPFSVVLLDEVEKAHPDVMELFYQVFDRGFLEDGEGISIDFRNTVILLTTNLGSATINQLCAPQLNEETEEVEEVSIPSPGQLSQALRPELQKYFKPALLARMTVVPYYPLGDDEITRIAQLKLNKLTDRFKQNHQADLSFSNDLMEAIAYRCFEAETGARNIDHILQQFLLPELSEKLLWYMSREEKYNQVQVNINDQGRFSYDFS